MVSRFGGLFALSFAVFLFQLGNGLASDSQPSRIQNQIDITIIHVDKYGVYGPKLVFYWDTGMGKQKIDGLMKAAEQLRNKKATITYSASGELSKDKRPMLIDLVAVREEPRLAGKEEHRFSTKEENKPAGKEETKLRSREEGRFVSEDTATIEEPQDLNRAEKEPMHMPSKEEKRRAAKEGTADTPQSPMTSLYGEQKQPAYPEQKFAQPSAHPVAITKDEVLDFIQRLLRLNESKDLNSVLLGYADQVNYYDRGVVTKDYIKRDMGYYFRNWSAIASTMEGDLVMIVTDQQDVRTVKFVSRYAVENARKSITGRVENIWKIQKINNQLKILDQKQKILSSETR